MGDFPKLQLGKRYLMYIRGNRKHESPIVGFHQGCFEVIRVGGQDVLLNAFGRPVLGVKDDRFVVLGAPPREAQGKMVTDPNFKPVPASPNADAIEARQLLRDIQRMHRTNRPPVEVPSTGPQSKTPVKLHPDDPGDQPPPKPVDPSSVKPTDRDATPIIVFPKDHDGKRITLTQFLNTAAKVR